MKERIIQPLEHLDVYLENIGSYQKDVYKLYNRSIKKFSTIKKVVNKVEEVIYL